MFSHCTRGIDSQGSELNPLKCPPGYCLSVSDEILSIQYGVRVCKNAQGLTGIPAFLLVSVLVGVFNTHIHTGANSCTLTLTHALSHPHMYSYSPPPQIPISKHPHTYTHTHSSRQTHANARLDTFALKHTSTHSHPCGGTISFAD